MCLEEANLTYAQHHKTKLDAIETARHEMDVAGINELDFAETARYPFAPVQELPDRTHLSRKETSTDLLFVKVITRNIRNSNTVKPVHNEVANPRLSADIIVTKAMVTRKSPC